MISFVIFSMLFNLAFVSAGIGDDIKNGLDKTIEVSDPIMKYILGSTPGGELLFVKFLVFILLLAIVGFAVKKVPALGENKLITIVIQVVVAILGARFLTTEQLVNFIWLPQGVFAIALTSLLPFIIFFFFIESFDSHVIRKVGWVVFLVIFAGISIYRWDTLNVGAGWWQNLGWLYLIIAVLSGLFLVLDKKIHRYFVVSGIRKGMLGDKAILESELREKLEKAEAAAVDPKLPENRKKAAKQEAENIGDAIARLYE